MPVRALVHHRRREALLLAWSGVLVALISLVTLLDGGVSSDHVGRLGGDEFAVLLPGAGAVETDAQPARLRAALAERAPASLGVVGYPVDGLDADALHQVADLDLYAVKQARGIERPGVAAPEALSWATALAHAVDERMALRHEHSMGVARHAALIGERLGFGDDELGALRQPRRPGRRGDPARGAHPARGRRVGRHDVRAALRPRRDGRRRPGGAAPLRGASARPGVPRAARRRAGARVGGGGVGSGRAPALGSRRRVKRRAVCGHRGGRERAPRGTTPRCGRQGAPWTPKRPLVDCGDPTGP
jgi:hypothetical protein